MPIEGESRELFVNFQFAIELNWRRKANSVFGFFAMQFPQIAKTAGRACSDEAANQLFGSLLHLAKVLISTEWDSMKFNWKFTEKSCRFEILEKLFSISNRKQISLKTETFGKHLLSKLHTLEAVTASPCTDWNQILETLGMPRADGLEFDLLKCQQLHSPRHLLTWNYSKYDEHSTLKQLHFISVIVVFCAVFRKNIHKIFVRLKLSWQIHKWISYDSPLLAINLRHIWHDSLWLLLRERETLSNETASYVEIITESWLPAAPSPCLCVPAL
jgi:hypothetical protein